MSKYTLSALAVVLSLGLATTSLAYAQSAGPSSMSSNVDTPNARVVAGSPGTVGAMNAVAYGLATSPDDVVLQQQGRGTLSEGAKPASGSRAETAGYAPGTVGATPGASAY